MRTLTEGKLTGLVGPYYAPEGLYQYIKSLPFLGTVTSNVSELVAGEWTEAVLTYEVGGSGLADGAWIKGTFKFYSDWALFQTSDPKSDNYVSAEYIPNKLHPGQTAATVDYLSVRFDQKGHERPFQKAIIIDVVDGYINPGDKIVVRLGDRRFGARGTRAQTFVEENFLMRWYIDPVGTSRFAAIKPDISINIRPGDIKKLKLYTPRVARPAVKFPLYVHAEDEWGNATINLKGLKAVLKVVSPASNESVLSGDSFEQHVHGEGWTYALFPNVSIEQDGEYIVTVSFFEGSQVLGEVTEYLSISRGLPVPRILFADLHVHSDDTVGTNSTSYNFSYAQKIAALDVVGYTANDFNITAAKWNTTLDIIRKVNETDHLVVFPGTEWCGNSAAGGDHNVVFLDDPVTNPPEFPLDKNGNVARSFEWNEDGPAELKAGAWPLDEVYATYAHSPASNLMIPHVGGRRCNLAWHHPQLERLLEIGSAWGLFEWLLRDAISRGWKLGVCANSDEHRGRCGGGVPGTAVFGTKGGLTGVLAPRLERSAIGTALRARHTFATTGERLVGLLWTGDAVQGDEITVPASNIVDLKYAFYGSTGFSSIEAWDANGLVFHRDLWREAETLPSDWKTIRITWGGARLYDRYREAIWDGTIIVPTASEITSIKAFGGVLDIPEERIYQTCDTEVEFKTHTSGDFDGVNLGFSGTLPRNIRVKGKLGGYVKVGDPLQRNPHKNQPEFLLEATWEEALAPGGKKIEIAGGAELFVRVEIIPDSPLPRRVEGTWTLQARSTGVENAVYFVGREWDGGKVISSPLFLKYE
jgi:hypothetical protein